LKPVLRWVHFCRPSVLTSKVPCWGTQIHTAGPNAAAASWIATVTSDQWIRGWTELWTLHRWGHIANAGNRCVVLVPEAQV
jgi:hypothetical protein